MGCWWCDCWKCYGEVAWWGQNSSRGIERIGKFHPLLKISTWLKLCLEDQRLLVLVVLIKIVPQWCNRVKFWFIFNYDWIFHYWNKCCMMIYYLSDELLPIGSYFHFIYLIVLLLVVLWLSVSWRKLSLVFFRLK